MIDSKFSVLLFGAINGFMIALAFAFFVLARDEDEFFLRMSNSVTTHKMNDEEKVEKLLELSHNIMRSRMDHTLPTNETAHLTLKEKWFSSTYDDFAKGTGACGSATAVFVRLAHFAGLRTRIVQIRP